MRLHMSAVNHALRRIAPSLSFALVVAFLLVLWIAGGASRADVPGQVVTRAAAWLVLIILILFPARADWRDSRTVIVLTAATLAMVVIQLIPLPPSAWLALPGRSILAEAAEASGQSQPYRPISISPVGTWNALWSLVVPVVTLVLALRLTAPEHRRLLTVLLVLTGASGLYALLQFSGGQLDHPLINDILGDVSGNFANRNHFALFAAIGCLLSPIWAFNTPRPARWRYPAAAALVVLFGLLILASGSRAGLLLGAIGIAAGLFAVRGPALRELKRLPRGLALAFVGGAFAFALAALVLSITMDRAVSLDRVAGLESGEDLRARALPVVLAITGEYFPVGTGFGTFDPAYRMAEPYELLNRQYFNHAHNDLLEIVLEGGILAAILLIAAIGWWLWKSAGVWRRPAEPGAMLPLAGSSVLLLVMVASIWDYPARTPIVMAVIILAAVWLARPASPFRSQATGTAPAIRQEPGRRMPSPQGLSRSRR